MKKSADYTKNIFCLEGSWDHDLRSKSSIGSALDFLHINSGIKNIHKHCGTKETLEYYLKKWKQKKYKDYSICYIAFHGKPGKIMVGWNEFVTLEELGDILEGACDNKIIYFGCCLTLLAKEERIQEFLKKTHALSVCGYTTSVEFISSTILEMFFLELLQDYKNMSAVENKLNELFGNLVSKLGFKIYRKS